MTHADSTGVNALFCSYEAGGSGDAGAEALASQLHRLMMLDENLLAFSLTRGYSSSTVRTDCG